MYKVTGFLIKNTTLITTTRIEFELFLNKSFGPKPKRSLYTTDIQSNRLMRSFMSTH